MNACPKCGLITGVHGSTLPGCMCLLTPQRKWVGLTDEEIAEIYRAGWSNGADFARTLEARLKEKNSTTEKITQISDKND